MTPVKILHGSEKDFERALTMQKVKCEEECIKRVLQNYLKREATIEDAKLCSQKISQPWNGSYQLFYNKILLGTVTYVESPERFRVEFTPIQKSN